ncbi:phosphoribosylglycinamide formyltransferase [Agrobacterium vaccinii]|uniref:phosphoribosylglycinamide formyltransferase n=1 Tax=Agrobacterium vaccinii TaxID=2735528 RepID=UPI001E3698B1|nr:phosphoribosylglycinamide formyltransferase [Agrobacterium vaccinii]UHS56198.1 phosphoribosylglycinamide formyltransferase [Agrobacterium vaccinii]
MSTAPARKRVVVFISGSGSNMMALAQACQAPDFPAEIACVISDKASAGGLAKAQSLGIPTLVFERKTYASKVEHEQSILAALSEIAPDIICLAGYMRLISAEFIAPYAGRIINIHPSLLPLFPGLHTHERAIESGMKITGCTVHFVTEGMDEGPVVGQAAVPVLLDDTPDTLAERVLTVEHQLYPLALKLLADGKVRMEGGRVARAQDACDAGQQLISA